MIEALEKCDWVQAITRANNPGDPATNDNQAAIGWFSQSKQIAAQEVGESRVYLNFRKKTAEDFDPTDRVIRQVTMANANRQHASNRIAWRCCSPPVIRRTR